jgi:hypothetical protein
MDCKLDANMNAIDCKLDTNMNAIDCKLDANMNAEYAPTCDTYYGCVVGGTDLRAIYKSDKIVVKATKNGEVRTYVVACDAVDSGFDYEPALLSENERYALIRWNTLTYSDDDLADHLLVIDLTSQQSYGTPEQLGNVYTVDYTESSENYYFIPLNNGDVHYFDTCYVQESYIIDMNSKKITTIRLPKGYQYLDGCNFAYSEDSICTFRTSHRDVTYNYYSHEMVVQNATGIPIAFNAYYNTLDKQEHVHGVKVYGYDVDDECYCVDCVD